MRYLLIFHDFIHASLFQSNSLSDEYSSCKLINYSNYCITGKYFTKQSPNMKTRIFKLLNDIQFVKIALGSDCLKWWAQVNQTTHIKHSIFNDT